MGARLWLASVQGNDLRWEISVSCSLEGLRAVQLCSTKLYCTSLGCLPAVC